MLNFKKIDNVTYKQIDIMKHTIGFNRGRIRGTYINFVVIEALQLRIYGGLDVLEEVLPGE